MPQDQPPRVGLNHYFDRPGEPSQLVTVFQEQVTPDTAALFARFHDVEPEDREIVVRVADMAGRFEWLARQ